MKANFVDKEFIGAVSKMKIGEELVIAPGEVLVLESRFTKPTHFAFHQRIFPAGVILKKKDSNVRIFLEAERVGMKAEKVKKGEFDDKQIKADGSVLPADRGLPRNKVNEELLKAKQVKK